jgi:hypothetical protein
MVRTTGDLQSRREMDAYYRWRQRSAVWLLATAGLLILTLIVLWGPNGGHPPDGLIPWWIEALTIAFIIMPPLGMQVAAFVHLVRSQRARRREANDGQTVYTNPVARFVDLHGIGVGLALVVVALALYFLWTLR